MYCWKLHCLTYISATESICISSTTFTQSAQKATKFGEITQPLGLLRRSRSFKVTEFGINRKSICHYLLVINSNLPPILHRFRDIASERSKALHFSITLWFNPPTEGFPLGRSSWNFTWMSSGHQRIKWHRNIAENCNRLSRVHERYRQKDRRQTMDDRRTDDDIQRTWTWVHVR